MMWVRMQEFQVGYRWIAARSCEETWRGDPEGAHPEGGRDVEGGKLARIDEHSVRRGARVSAADPHAVSGHPCTRV